MATVRLCCMLSGPREISCVLRRWLDEQHTGSFVASGSKETTRNGWISRRISVCYVVPLSSRAHMCVRIYDSSRNVFVQDARKTFIQRPENQPNLRTYCTVPPPYPSAVVAFLIPLAHRIRPTNQSETAHSDTGLHNSSSPAVLPFPISGARFACVRRATLLGLSTLPFYTVLAVPNGGPERHIGAAASSGRTGKRGRYMRRYMEWS